MQAISAMVPLLDFGLTQTNAQGAYVYRFQPLEGTAELTASAGLSDTSAWFRGEVEGRFAREHFGRNSPIVLHEGAWLDGRFRGFPEFQSHRFEGVASIPLIDSGQAVGVANICRIASAPIGARDLSFLLSLSLPLGALVAAASARQSLSEEVEKLNQQLADRKLVERAKGLLQSKFQWTEEQAYFYVRRLSRQRRTAMRYVALAVIESGGEPPAERGPAMKADPYLPTRQEFLVTIAATVLAAQELPAQSAGKKALIVVAHPDDEYAFAATTYRLVRELGWTVDQVLITNGEAGYRYSSLAEAIYGVALHQETDGRAHLPAIRKQEAARAGKILGIRRHYFLDQKDLGFTTDAASASAANWDRKRVLAFLGELLAREHYDVVFTLLPTAETHGHHSAATLLALEAVSHVDEGQRPLFFGVEPRSKSVAAPRFEGLPGEPLTAAASSDPVLVFDRTTALGYRGALNYQVIVNWVIAEHKSQGLFQMDAGRHELEQFWLLAISGPGAISRVDDLRAELCAGSTNAPH